eukprot:scaffold43575_cov41-Cyclotella_meneghiniana.AAC.8
MSECLQPLGRRLGGSDVTFLKAPRQSEYIRTFPPTIGCTLSTASSIRCMAISPRSSPLYAHARFDCSGKEPKILPLPRVHSSTKAAEHTSPKISRM